jgi:lysyl-tRNA synthetase class 1
VFEPGGQDHAAPGGSYDVASTLSHLIFQREAPVFIGYEFIKLQGIDGKMSGSSGLAISPAKLLEIYEPALLQWLYARKSPSQGFALAFDSEVFRQYDEFDREVAARASGTLDAMRCQAIDLSLVGSGAHTRPMPFRQAVAFGQIVQWDAAKVAEVSTALGLEYERSSIDLRLVMARSWLETYNRGEMIRLNESVNQVYVETMTAQALSYVRQLHAALASDTTSGVAALESLVYAIPKDASLEQKENALRQRAFFKDVYNLLIGSSTGPRLSTFLWAVDRQTVLKLLAV